MHPLGRRWAFVEVATHAFGAGAPYSFLGPPCPIGA